MKILYVITKSNWGGAQKYVFDLALAMKNSGHDVSVAFGGKGILSEKLEKENIRTINIASLERDVNILKELEVFSSLYKIFKKENPHIVHLNSSKIGAIGSFIGRLAGIRKIIFTAHGFSFREERPWWQIFLIKILSWLTIVFSHKTICVSQKDFQDVENWPFVKGKLEMVHNGIAILGEYIEREKDAKINIVSIGELHKNKGFEYGIKAISILKEKIQNFRYNIFSFGGEEEKDLHFLIKSLNLEEFVSLNINKENHADKLKDADIYFMPSIKEGLPYVLLEAELASLPIVASDTGGIKEIVENNKNGFLFMPKDINAFSLGLERLILDKDLRLSFGRNSREKVVSEFDMEKMIQKTKEVYSFESR
jgi:glycosyltransferase involved in cell wall biosynthesis